MRPRSIGSPSRGCAAGKRLALSTISGRIIVALIGDMDRNEDRGRQIEGQI
jgi:hypothetical protein